jgi:membrane associated rhomboid family serine protease
MPVEFDAPEEQRMPWATWLLSAIIICASLLAFSNLREVVQGFGLIPAEATRLDGLTFVTIFLHAGIIHLAGNTYFLLAFGDAVENFLRPARYLALIALAALIGDLALSPLILVRKYRASAPAGALLVSLRFTR